MIKFLFFVSLIFHFQSSINAAEKNPHAIRILQSTSLQKTGGFLLSGGGSWNTALWHLGFLHIGSTLGAQILRNQSGTFVPAFDLGFQFATQITDQIRFEPQVTALFAPFQAGSLSGVTKTATPTVGGNILWSKPLWIFDGLWIGVRQWMTADSVNEVRIGGSIEL